MTGLRARIDEALNEARALILVSEVMLGFQYRAAFEPAFSSLSANQKSVQLAALGLMLLALALLALPAADHQIGERGRDSRVFHDLAGRAISIALLPFGLSLALSVYLAGSIMAGVGAALGLAAVVAGLALFFWFVLGLVTRGSPMSRGPLPRIVALPRSERVVDIDHKVHELLTEARLVLPGAQALLGFQFSVTLMTGFEQVTGPVRDASLWSLALIALSTILLMTPSAYHRIAERGENTERFVRLAGRVLIAAMIALALALTGDTFVAVARITGAIRPAEIAALATASGFTGLWFAFPMLRRIDAERERAERVRKEARS
jgi:hypothetical protein